MIGNVDAVMAIGPTIKNPLAEEELAATAGGWMPNPKDSPEEIARKKQRAIDRYFDRLARKQARATAELVVDKRPSAPKWIIPTLLLAAVGLGAFFLFRRKKG